MAVSARRILIVDDDPSIRRLIRAVLKNHFDIAEAECGEDALKLVNQFHPDIVLLDIEMPGIDGCETCRQLKTMLDGDIPQVIMVSARSSRQEQLHAFEFGADDYVLKPFDAVELRSRIDLNLRLMDARHQVELVEAELRSRHAELKREADNRLQQMIATQDLAVFTLARLSESRDKDTGQHLVRMRKYTLIIADQLRTQSPYSNEIDDCFLEDLFRSAPLHDIGKVGVPDEILLKPGRFTEEEFELMKQHTVIGANILDDAVMHSNCGGFLAMAATIARFHHERWDGLGYPAGLVGDEIPLPARIVSVADVFDALTTVRPYKDAFPPHVAKEIMEDGAARQFDPAIVEAFCQRFDEITEVQAAHESTAPTTVGAMSFVEPHRVMP